ncbi:glucose 1-dehydrogenase [Alicyclobacillus cycloheptanicus]|nr:glucose 1-dehydrogenase [Alicyclobacillus cycloheptanicus]
MNSAGEFADKVVIVTGGAQGIGAAVSAAFGRARAAVVIADVDEEAGREHLLRLQAAGTRAMFVRTDVSAEVDVKRLVDEVLRSFGRIDVLVNNAGVFDTKSILERTVEEWDRIISINLRGPYMMAKYCAPALMQANPGVIINMASTRALMSEPNTEPYSASKGGIVALTHALAVSLGPKVRVNAISPGWIEVRDYQKSSKRERPVHTPGDLAQHPVGRVGNPEDIAELCLYLASPRAGFMTGTNLVVDGGMTRKMIYEE